MKKVVYISMALIFSLFINCSEDTIDFVGLGTITGRIIEAGSFNPIANAKITINPTNNTVFSDADGYFKMEDVEAGDYSVSTVKEGYLTSYEPATVTKDLTVNVILKWRMKQP